jgi:hypothetical protein
MSGFVCVWVAADPRIWNQKKFNLASLVPSGEQIPLQCPAFCLGSGQQLFQLAMKTRAVVKMDQMA